MRKASLRALWAIALGILLFVVPAFFFGPDSRSKTGAIMNRQFQSQAATTTYFTQDLYAVPPALGKNLNRLRMTAGLTKGNWPRNRARERSGRGGKSGDLSLPFPSLNRTGGTASSPPVSQGAASKPRRKKTGPAGGVTALLARPRRGARKRGCYRETDGFSLDRSGD